MDNLKDRIDKLEKKKDKFDEQSSSLDEQIIKLIREEVMEKIKLALPEGVSFGWEYLGNRKIGIRFDLNKEREMVLIEQYNVKTLYDAILKVPQICKVISELKKEGIEIYDGWCSI